MKEKGLKLHHFLSHILPVIQLVVFILSIIVLIINAFSADNLAETIINVVLILLYIPLLILVISILSVKNELSEKCYKRVRLYYWISLVVNSINVIIGLSSGDFSGLFSSLVWIVISILILVYYKNRRDIFCTPWNDSETLYCRKCGSQLVNGSSFCQNCGEKVN